MRADVQANAAPFTIGQPKDPWATVDPLGEALHFLHMSGVVYTRSELTAPWGLELPAMPDCMMFHVVTHGPCWLGVNGADPQLLKPGEFALVPHGESHRIVSASGVAVSKLFDLPREQISERYEVLRYGGGGEPTSLVCGAVRFDHPAARRLIGVLPKTLRLETSDTADAEWIHALLRLMAVEARELRAGGEAVITRLADILVVQAIRSWISQDPAAQTGWLGALRDKQIGRAMSLIHRDPARAWTVASLAAEVAMSRSAFAARFTELVGESAMRYVARARMQLALKWLKEDDVSIAAIASRLGYESEAAFSRAFKRLIGASPGTERRK